MPIKRGYGRYLMIAIGVKPDKVADDNNCAPYGIIPCPKEANISRRDAARVGDTSNSSLSSFAIGPAITIATVLLAVHKSNNNTKIDIPNSAPRFPRILFFTTCKI